MKKFGYIFILIHLVLQISILAFSAIFDRFVFEGGAFVKGIGLFIIDIPVSLLLYFAYLIPYEHLTIYMLFIYIILGNVQYFVIGYLWGNRLLNKLMR